jgi:hypothetical protein
MDEGFWQGAVALSLKEFGLCVTSPYQSGDYWFLPRALIMRVSGRWSCNYNYDTTFEPNERSASSRASRTGTRFGRTYEVRCP